MVQAGPRVAGNPIPYWVVGDVVNKSREAFEEAFRDLSEIGYTAIKVDVPSGMSTKEYREWIESYNLAPATGNFSAAFHDPDLTESTIERARDFASQQLELGLDVTMVTAAMVPERLAVPAVGAMFDEDRLKTIIENIGAVAQVFQNEGVTPLIHPHVGGWIETEGELRSTLDTLGSGLVGFGPDTGHMRWAGMDPASVIQAYRSRVQAIHIKDVFPDYLAADKASGSGYFELTGTKRVWAEPGRGIIDFEAVVGAMPLDFAGDYMIEVDVPSVESRYESQKISYDWARSALSFARI